MFWGKDTKMPILLMDEAVRERIREVVEYAETHPMTTEDLKDIIAGKKQSAGDDNNHVIKLSKHYRVVYSQEIQPDGKWYHHLSVSVPGRTQGKMPSIPVVKLIMEEFGMGNRIFGQAAIWDEDHAINILKKIE